MKTPFYAQCNTVWNEFGLLGGDMLKDMISAKKPISHKKFLKTCDTRRLLEGETLKEYLSADTGAGVYESTFNGKPCQFIQFAGFEFIWLLSST